MASLANNLTQCSPTPSMRTIINACSFAMPVSKLQQLVKDDFNAVTNVIVNLIAEHSGLIEDLSEHLVKNGGKRLRPLLVLLSAKACGYEGQQHILHAAAIEFFHTATLLHDDVLDDSALRRGVETAYKIWGAKASILVGDFLYTQSVKLMVEAGHFQALAVLVEAANLITRGEVNQLSNQHRTDVNMDEYFKVIRAKTSELFSAASEIGTLVAVEDKAKVEAMRYFGLHVGNAFQIIDDALDYAAKPAQMGKNQGDDLKDGKLTLPLIYALEKASIKECHLIKESIEQGASDNLAKIIDIIDKTQALTRTYDAAKVEIDKALSALSVLDQSPYKDALTEYAQYALMRSH